MLASKTDKKEMKKKNNNKYQRKCLTVNLEESEYLKSL